MQEYIEKRVMEICEYIIETGATVRQAAAQFGVSKSTVHKDLIKENGFFGLLNNIEQPFYRFG